MLNINCSICTELIKHTDEVCVTFCGHMFHYACIKRWLERSRTCPQCRNASKQSTIIRVFFNLSNIDANQLNAIELVEELDNTKLQLNLKTADLDKANQEIGTLKLMCSEQTSTILELKAQCKKDKLLLNNYSDQVKLLKYQVSEMAQLHEKIQQKDRHLKELTDLQTMLNCAKPEYEKLLKSENDPKTLAVWVSTLKRELRSSEIKRNEIRAALKSVQNDLRKELELNRLQLQQFKDLESENYILKEKLKNVNKEQLNSTIKEEDVEQQAGIENMVQVKQQEQQEDQEELEQIQDAPKRPKKDILITKKVNEPTADSPYLNIKASLVGFSTIYNLQKKYAYKLSEGNTQCPQENDDAIITTCKLTKLQLSPRKKATGGAIPKNKSTSIKNQQRLLMAGGPMAFPSNDPSTIYAEGPVCSKTIQLQQSTVQGANEGSWPTDRNLMPMSANTNKKDPKRTNSSIENRLRSGRLRSFRINKYKK